MTNRRSDLPQYERKEITLFISENASICRTRQTHHSSALLLGGISGVISVTGLGILTARRFGLRPIRMTSAFSDLFVLILLAIVMGIGLLNTLGSGLSLFQGFDYRETMVPWFRGLILLQPDSSLMMSVPTTYQFHVLATMALVAIWPFTRLIHVWAFPISYLWRPYIVYREKAKKEEEKVAPEMLGASSNDNPLELSKNGNLGVSFPSDPLSREKAARNWDSKRLVNVFQHIKSNSQRENAGAKFSRKTGGTTSKLFYESPRI